MTENKIRSAQIDAHIREHQRKHAAYFAFLDQLKPANRTQGAYVDALVKEFGIGVGDAHGAYLHWMVSARDGGTPEQRAEFMGGM